MKVKIGEVVMLDVKDIKKTLYNPNMQDPITFNYLCEQIKETGFNEPILVCPKKNEEGKYVVISGEHRLDAMIALGEKKIPAIIKEDWDEDMQKFQNIRFNVLRGKLNPEKFAKLYREMQAKYGDEAVQSLMMMDEDTIKTLVKDVKKALPKDMIEDFEKVEDEINNIDNLADILNTMFSKYGNTLEFNFMVFEFGGKTHHWVRLNKYSNDMITQLESLCVKNDIDMNTALIAMILKSDIMTLIESKNVVEDLVSSVDSHGGKVDDGKK